MERLKTFDNIQRTKTFSYFMISLSAIIYTLGVQAFLQEAEIFPTGLGAFVMIITYTSQSIKPFFSLIYLAMNIPLIILFWKKIKKQFVYKTACFLIVQAAFGSLFTIDAIGDPITSIFSKFEPFRVGKPGETPSGWPIIIMSVIGAVFAGMGIAVSWKYGGSSGGTDIITYYYSTKKGKSIGRITMILGIAIALFSFGVTLAIEPNMRELWYLTLLSTFVYLIIISWMIDWIFPKYSKVKLSIHSEKHEEIHKYLLDSKFEHAFYSKKIKSGYSNKEKTVIESVVLLLEVRSIIREILKIDPNVWISVKDVRKVVGNFTTTSVEE